MNSHLYYSVGQQEEGQGVAHYVHEHHKSTYCAIVSTYCLIVSQSIYEEELGLALSTPGLCIYHY